MKLSVSLPDQDVATLDEYARKTGLPSRSGAVRQAIYCLRQSEIELLRQSEIEDDYVAAWEEWDHSGQRELWADTFTDRLM